MKTADPLVIDARDLLCPLPVLRLRKRLEGLAPGSIVTLFATDPAAVIDVPHFCQQGGHCFLGMQVLPDGTTAYRVEKGNNPRCGPEK